MAPRLNCMVPNCHRTRGPRKGDVEPLTEDCVWICGEHWMLIRKDRRRAESRARRVYFKAKERAASIGLAETGPEASPEYLKAVAELSRARFRWDVIWLRCSREAIEKAMGI